MRRAVEPDLCNHRSMVRRGLVIVAVILSIAACVSAAELGSKNVGPAPFGRCCVRVASSATETLVVWNDGRAGAATTHQIYAARLSGDGMPLDSIRIPGSQRSDGWRQISLASDGQAFLIIWNDSHGLHGASVSADGVASAAFEVLPAPTGLFSTIAPEALSWNGKSYALVFEANGRHVLMLDRSGAVISGALRDHNNVYGRMKVASSDGRWLVTSASTRGTIGSGDFPPVGQIADFVLPHVNSLEVIAPAGDGYVGAWGDSFGIHAQRLDSDGLASGPALHFANSPSIYESYDVSAVAATSDQIVVQYGFAGRTEHVVFDAGGARLLKVIDAREADLAIGSGGFTAAWTNGLGVRAARAGSRTWEAAGALLSVSLRAQRHPILTEGGGAVLATWLESTSSTQAIVSAMLDRHGNLMSEPEEIAVVQDRGSRFHWNVAFGDSRYLIVWYDFPELRGRFVSSSGHPLGERFDIRLSSQFDQEVWSLVWDGRHFVLTSEKGAHRLQPTGQTLDGPISSPKDAYVTLLAKDGDGFLAVWGEVKWCQPCPVLAEFSSLPLTSELNVDGAVEPIGKRIDVYDSSPALAANQGRALMVWWGYYERRWTASVFSREGILHSRSLPEYGAAEARAHIVTFGTGFVVAAGPTLALHDRSLTSVAISPIASDAVESAVALDGADAIVLYQRGPGLSGDIEVPRLSLVRMPLPRQVRRRAVGR
jgi:hypothetical protein